MLFNYSIQIFKKAFSFNSIYIQLLHQKMARFNVECLTVCTGVIAINISLICLYVVLQFCIDDYYGKCILMSIIDDKK